MKDSPKLPAPRARGSVTTSQSGVAEVGQVGLAAWSVEYTSDDGGALTAGNVLHGKYVVGELLGRGRSGTVHRAHTTATRREVALKVQTDVAADDPAMQRRFVREMRLLASIDHPGVLEVFEIGRLPDGHLGAALELFEGPTLREVLGRGALAPLRAVEIAAQLLSILGAVHERQLVHRDLTPSNVLVQEDRGRLRVKLIGFGIARAVANDTHPITTPAEVLGTPGYLAPERAVPGAPIDGRSDLFALGVTLYEMLVGDRPFGDTGASLVQGLAAGAAPLRHVLSRRVSPGLRELVVSLLAANPDLRGGSASMVFERIGQVPEAVGVELQISARSPEVCSPRVMVISESKVQREAWSRAVRGAGGRVITIASVEAAVLLLESAPYPTPTHVLISALVKPGDEDARAELESLGPERLAGIIYVEPARLRGYTSTEPWSEREYETTVTMPVTEAELRRALRIEG